MTISGSIQLHDGMTGILRNMQQAMHLTIKGFERMRGTANNGMPIREFDLARERLHRVGAAIREAELKQDDYNDSVRRGTAENDKLISTLSHLDASISGAERRQNGYNNAVQRGATANNGLLRVVRRVVLAVGSLRTAKGIIRLSDSMSQTTARLNLMNDGLRTTEQLNNAIMASAQRSRGSYLATADAVAKMGIRAGDIFKSNDETIAFVEQLNKQFAISGASQQEMYSATLQLTQSMKIKNPLYIGDLTVY